MIKGHRRFTTVRPGSISGSVGECPAFASSPPLPRLGSRSLPVHSPLAAAVSHPLRPHPPHGVVAAGGGRAAAAEARAAPGRPPYELAAGMALVDWAGGANLEHLAAPVRQEPSRPPPRGDPLNRRQRGRLVTRSTP